MSNIKEKSKGFIIGVMVGLIVAGGFFIFKLDDYFNALEIYKSVSNTLSSKNKEAEPVVIDKAPNDENLIKKKIKKVKVIEEEKEFDEKKIVQTEVSKLSKDSLIINENSGDGNIIVRKDELLSTKTIEVFVLDVLAKINSKDSLIKKAVVNKDENNSAKQFLNVEFWSSPLNYKGYKMMKYKLVLYGITSAEDLKLFKLDDIVYLKKGSFVYRLDPYGDFRPYERITDETVINKLK